MTLLGRHILPQKEANERASNGNFAANTFLRGILGLSTVFLTMILASQSASAQLQSEKVSAATSPVSAIDILSTTQSSNFKLQMPETRSTRLLDLNLDFESIGCLVSEQNCLRDTGPVDVAFSKRLKKNSKKGLDVELVPTASVRFDDDSRSAVVGAVVRIGEDLRSKDVASNTWYIFAGADAEALSYSPESLTGLTRGEFGLSERVIIGDAQAGVGYRIGSADVSLGYFRREVSTLNDSAGTEGFSKTEDAAALSFTWKR